MKEAQEESNPTAPEMVETTTPKIIKNVDVTTSQSTSVRDAFMLSKRLRRMKRRLFLDAVADAPPKVEDILSAAQQVLGAPTGGSTTWQNETHNDKKAQQEYDQPPPRLIEIVMPADGESLEEEKSE